MATDRNGLRWDPEWRCAFHGERVWKVSRKTGRRYPGCRHCHAFGRLLISFDEARRLVDGVPF